MGANHVLNSERPATSNASGTTWPVQPSLVNEPFSDLEALRPHFENDVVLTRVINLRPKSSFGRVEYEDTAMAKDKEPFEGLTTAAQQTAKQITEQTQGRWKITLVGYKRPC